MKKIIENFQPLSGKHCITNSLRQLFYYQGFNISESMLFGLGSGLSWFYMENKALPFPIISGRTKPLDFENKLAENTGIKIKVVKTSSAKRAFEGMKRWINYNIPVMLYVDMAFLKFLNLPEDSHFGGHSIIVFGIDEDEGVAYISDRDGVDNSLHVNGKLLNNDFYKISLDELAIARDSKFGPFPAQNKWIEIDFSNFAKVTPHMINMAMESNLKELLNPPIKNLSVSGIEKFSKGIIRWRDFEKERLKSAAINCFFMIDEKGGTGGAAFRKMYAGFLNEASEICSDQTLKLMAEDYMEVSTYWDRLAAGLWKLYETANNDLLPQLSTLLKTIAAGEYDILQKMKKVVYAL